jgi:hypothetical protein
MKSFEIQRNSEESHKELNVNDDNGNKQEELATVAKYALEESMGYHSCNAKKEESAFLNELNISDFSDGDKSRNEEISEALEINNEVAVAKAVDYIKQRTHLSRHWSFYVNVLMSEGFLSGC